MWLFGYGSIIWKTGFEFEERQAAFIRGWARRFWQASADHRGTPEAPGRVVTLVPAPGEICHGMAYRLPDHSFESIIEELDYREKNGYVRDAVTIEFEHGGSTGGIVYHAAEDNPHFLGEAPMEEIAAQIASSHGPSGSNKEYILQLSKALDELNIHDDHVAALARLVAETGSKV